MRVYRSIVVFIMMFLAWSGATQEVITDFSRVGHLSNVFLHEEAGLKYVIEVTPQDDLLVYRVEGGQAVLSWRQNVPGVFNEVGVYSHIDLIEEYVVLDLGSSLSVYDINDGQLTSYDNPLDSPSIWVRHLHDDIVSVVFNGVSIADRIRLKIDLGSQQVDTLEGVVRVRYLSDNLEVLESSSDSSSFDVWQVKELLSGDTWSIEHEGPLYGATAFSDSLFVYRVGDSILYVDRFEQKPTLIYMHEESDYRYLKTYDLGSHYAIVEDDGSYSAQSHLVLFDKATRDTTEHLFAADLGSKNLIKVGDFLVTDEGLVVDLAKDTLYRYESHWPEVRPIVVEDSILVVAHRDPEVRVIGQADYQYPFPFFPEWRPSSLVDPQVMELEDSWLVCFPVVYDGGAKLWTFPKGLSRYRAMDQSDLLPDGGAGLREEAQLIAVGPSLALLEDDLYAVIDDEVTKINQRPLLAATARYEKVCLSQDTLFWAENTSFGARIGWYAGDQYGTYASFDFEHVLDDLGQFAVANGMIYFETYPRGSDTLRIRSRSGDINRKVPLEKWLGVLELLTVEDEVYMTRKDSLCYIDPQGIHEILPLLPRSELLSTPLNSVSVLQGRRYFPSIDGIYDITIPDAPQLVAPVNNLGYTIQFSEDYLRVQVRDSLDPIHLFDGTRLSPPVSSVSGEGRRLWSHLIGHYFGMVSRSSSSLPSAIYDFELGEFIELPSPLNTQVPVKAVIHQGDTLLITSLPEGIAADIMVYRMSNTWQQAELVESFEYGGNVPDFDYKSQDDDGLMYVGDDIYLVDQALNFLPLQGVSADVVDRSVLVNGDYFYFIGIDDETGRQVFRVLMPSRRSPTSIEEDSEAQLSVYPNPTADFVHIDLPMGAVVKYKIVSAAGRVVSAGTTSGVLDLSHCHAGLYVVLLTVEDKCYAVRIQKY